MLQGGKTISQDTQSKAGEQWTGLWCIAISKMMEFIADVLD